MKKHLFSLSLMATLVMSSALPAAAQKSIHIGENNINICYPNWNVSDQGSFEWFGENIFLFHSEHYGRINTPVINVEGDDLYVQVFDLDHNKVDGFYHSLLPNKDYYIGLCSTNFREYSDLKVTFYQDHTGENHQRSETTYSGKEPTCTTSGFTSYMVCPTCGIYYFIDDNDKEESAYLPPLGHDMHDGHCLRCNELSLPELKLGNNTINTASVTDGQNMYWWDFDGNLYTFTAPVAGPFKVETKGAPTYLQLFRSSQEIFDWGTNENVMELSNLEEGQTIFIGVMAKSHESLNGLTINLYMPQDGDLNHDGEISASDVSALIDKILEKDKEGK